MDTYVEDDGPVCTVCERRVSLLHTTEPDCCKICASGQIATHLFQEQMEETPDALPNALAEVKIRTSGREGPQTLVFLAARNDRKEVELDVGQFDELWESLLQNENNPGRFGGTNRPGYPLPMKLMAKCASASSARAPLNMMHERTYKQPDDVFTLNLLADIIVFSYRPGDIVIIGMNTPTNFCVGHRDLESFILDITSRGIPASVLYFFYHAMEIGAVKKNEVVVLADDLRVAIKDKLPRYGMVPGRIDNTAATLSAVLYAMEQGRIHDRNITVPLPQQQP